MMNWIIDMAILTAVYRGRLKRERSRNGWGMHRSRQKRRAEEMGTIPIQIRAFAELQPHSAACMKKIVRKVTAQAKHKKPHKSILLGWDTDAGRSVRISHKPIAAMGTLTQKIQRHERASVK